MKVLLALIFTLAYLNVYANEVNSTTDCDQFAQDSMKYKRVEMKFNNRITAVKARINQLTSRQQRLQRQADKQNLQVKINAKKNTMQNLHMRKLQAMQDTLSKQRNLCLKKTINKG